MKKENLLLQLYISFMKIGGLTFGGGLSMLPMLKYELVEKREWISEEDLLNCYAIGQCTPGIIAVNTATYVGYIKKGIIGGIVSTLGMITPSIVIITVIAAFLKQFMDNALLQNALMGIRGAVCALMLNTLINMGKKSLISISAWIICAIAFLLIMFLNLPSIFIVLFGGICGIALDKLTNKKDENERKADLAKEGH